ncbi:PepSY domain-containing protein [Sphingobacterium sp. HJSM2_6]|uniref:PepSY domain-containing protein n=1 Tax=Sphingobacterium sp. HJSM2_6 TaxID=3366264 RepID=UPI003BD29667
MNKPKKTQTSTWIKVRKFLNDIHLWGGLISGIVVFIVCLTGTIYVYNTEIRAWALSEYYQVKPEGEKVNPDELLAKVRPEIKGKVVGIKIPHADDQSTSILYTKKEEGKGREKTAAAADTPVKGDRKDGHAHTAHDHANEKGHKHSSDSTNEVKDPAKAGQKEAETKSAPEGNKELAAAPTAPELKREAATKAPAAGPASPGGRGPRANQMSVNPYTAEIIGDASDVKSKTAEFMQKMFGLHRWLLLNEIEEPIFEGIENRKLGSWISGTATLLFLLGVITGMVIWFPNKIRSWKNGLNIRWSANWKRVNHDLHNTLGFYSCILLFLMSVTGPFWSFDWYRSGWQKTWGTYQAADAPKVEKKVIMSTILAADAKPISIEETIAAVNKALPYEGDITINFAKDSTGTISISKNRVGFFAPSAGDKLTLDQYSAEVLEKDIFRDKPFNERASASVKALHVGDIYGPFSKLLYFIACLIATSLPVTGVMIWINKMKKKPKKVK